MTSEIEEMCDVLVSKLKRYLDVFRKKGEVDGSRKTGWQWAIGFNMEFTNNLAKGSLSEYDSEFWARGALKCFEGRNLKQEYNQLFQGMLLWRSGVVAEG